MHSFLIFILIILIIYCTTSWILPKVIACLIERKFRVVVRIGRIGIPYLKLYDVHIAKKGFAIHVDEISIKSSFLNSDLTKLVTLVVKDVRINKDIIEFEPNEVADDIQPVDFRDKKVPPFINTFAQFMAVHVYNVSIMLLHSESPGWLVHANANELHLDGSIVQNARTLIVNVTLTEACAKLLRHPEKQANEETCLGQLSFAITMEATLVAKGPLSVEKLCVSTTQIAATINDSFYSLGQETKRNTRRASNSYEDNYYRILPIIPKNFIYKMEDISIRGVRKNSRTEFISSLKMFSVNSRIMTANSATSTEQSISHMHYSFQMSDLHLYNNKEKLLLLKLLKLDAKLEKNVVNLCLKLNTLLLTYNHEAIYHWIETNFRKHNPKNPLPNREVSNRANARNSNLFQKLAKRLIINGCAEFCQVSAIVNLYGSRSYVGFNHIKLILEQAAETRDVSYSSYFPNLVLANRHWQIEVLMESLWWSFKEWKKDQASSKKVHRWGTPIYLGMTLLKFGTYGAAETKIETLLDALQLEWSLNLATYVLLAFKCLSQYNVQIRQAATPKRTSTNHSISVNLALTHFNVFLQTHTGEYVVSRLNSVTVERNSHAATVHFKGFKVAVVTDENGAYGCVRTEDMPNHKLFIRTVEVEYNNETAELTVLFLEEIISHWSTNFHLKILTLQRGIVEFIANVREHHCLSNEKSKVAVPVWDVKICGVFEFHIWISQNHSARISLDNIEVSCRKNVTWLSDSAILISIDDADIFTIQGLRVARIEDNPMIRAERLDNENFRLPWNKTWELSIGMFKAIFPHEHSYADAIQNDFISIWKWLKITHNLKRKSFTIDSPLPSDLLINVKEFLFEMSDDPFEVKLRDNFELLEDEYSESFKRQKMLKAKIAELCKTHMHLPAGKVEELYANLTKKNAEIYVQRSKQMMHTAPSRTRLFAWSMTDVEIMVLADLSMHGTDNVIKIIREIDFDSPWPEEPMEFSTLWCRVVSLRCAEWKFQLRDFRQPLLDIRQFYVCGQLAGAEQMAPRRATRDVPIDLGEPWGSVTVQRSMLPLKFYHDFNCEIQSYSYAFGPCWEPVIAQCNLTFEKIIPPSRDPSPPLPFWDKMRLLLHGRLTMVVQQLTVLLHASLDPYNTTEEMELTWNQVIMDWTNAKFVYKGDLNIFVRTASKYDDCKLLHLPNLKLIVNIQWASLGDPNDHHSVIQCAPDKIPEYSSNQEHDSFRAFRSQNIHLGVVLETKPIANQSPTGNIDYPMLSLYSSTLRWIESLKLILSGITRPTKRGTIFNNVRPRKIQLSRHYKKIHLLMGLHKFQVCYWMSFAMQRGFELLGGRLSSSSEHSLALVPVDDGLKHRPKTEWSIVYMNSELNDTEIWLKSALQEDPEKEAISLRQPVEKCFCLSVAKVSYGRETVLLSREHPTAERNKDTPTHRLVVYDLKGAWTKSNRNVAFALFDSFMRNQRMKKNLSTAALKGFRKESSSTPLKRRNAEASATSPTSTIQTLQTSTIQGAPSPLTKTQTGHAANMLKQLIAEADNKAVVFSDDLSSATRQQHLQGLQACQDDDVVHKNWLIALVNAQVLLKGCETKGYVILSSAKAEILQKIHRPVWKDRALVSKTTWVGSLECLQYYATVNAGENDSLNENIMWLTVDNIQEKESTVISEIPQVPNIVGSGVSVGAVVSDVVGASSNEENWPIQLQRIVSRCKCEFFYASYGDISVDPEEVGEVPAPLQEDVGLWDRRQTAVDAFTLMHHDLDVCTNSLQYAMLLDIVNNLLLYVEPHRKEALERLARMRFQLQLHSVEDQRRPIQILQNQIRSTVSKLRRLERETYLLNKAVAEEPNNLELLHEMENLEELVYNCKGQLNAQSEELDMMISCYKEAQLLANSRLATTRNDKPLTIVRANEICFKHAQWRLTEADGQIGIADLVLSNFLYTKNSKSDDSVEHLLELGYLRMTNLLPNQIYKEVLVPTEIQSNMPVEHKRVVRVFCREKPPVGGIAVKEHFEINVVPLTIGLTKKFYNTMLKFCFPEKDPDNIDGERGEELDNESRSKRIRSSGRSKRDSNFYIPIDDVEKMKERAEKNKLFIYIKIPEVPVRVSYKGNKEKNLEDIRDFSLVIPTLEYHNVTWTWLDLLLAMKSDTRRVILSQAIKQKLQIKRSTGLSDESSSPQEEDKARLLFGACHSVDNRNPKKSMSSVFKFGK
ncbi:hypothetical protein PPYR_13710 [Photinus pyralis]|uniref:FMP27/BLTP2/Hobbit GFWDK motif-containing RBG unit domain-containing protein n=2 Tax=Photinus pyralis TaxID=7054 RepID=A0A5N4A9T9_PHOPY|nr:protein KIAA0100 [Photinus pyralis]KAB0794090.1 hypothetical protein PPYR_13710 [Photinus pyralis]